MTDRNAPRSTQTRLVNVQVLRGVAALMVLVAHAVDLNEELSGRGDEPGVLGHLQNAGAFGVDLFFVISGFVMAFSVAGKSGGRAAGDFLARRWIRIAPPYLVASVIAILVFGYYRRAAPSGNGLANMLLMVPVLDRGGYTSPPLDIGWTLSFEFTFYLFVALAIVLRQRVEVLGAGLVALVLIGRVIPSPPFLVSWFTNPILLEFALGIAVYVVWSRGLLGRVRPLWLGLAAAGVAALAVEMVVGYGLISEQAYTTGGDLSAHRVLLWGVPAALIFVGVVTLREPKEGPVLRVGRTLGDASYSTYLLHRPALVLLGAQVGFSPLPIPPAATIAAAVLAGTGAGLLYFRTVEQPMTQRLTALYRRLLSGSSAGPRTAQEPIRMTAVRHPSSDAGAASTGEASPAPAPGPAPAAPAPALAARAAEPDAVVEPVLEPAEPVPAR